VVCASGVELLNDYLEGVLPDDLRSELEAHVVACPRCTAFVAAYRETPRLLREATAAALPAELEASLMRFLRGRIARGE
jgi:anti-sigma factor RsiW